MRVQTWLFGMCLVLIGCDGLTIPAPTASSAPTASPTATVQALPAVQEELPVAPTKADPRNPPGPDYIWVRPYTKSDGTHVEGYWKHKPAKPGVTTKPKPAPRVVTAPTPLPRVETNSTSGKVWVDGHWRKTKNGRTWVDGHWRNK